MTQPHEDNLSIRREGGLRKGKFQGSQFPRSTRGKMPAKNRLATRTENQADSVSYLTSLCSKNKQTCLLRGWYFPCLFSSKFIPKAFLFVCVFSHILTGIMSKDSHMSVDFDICNLR